MNDSLLANTAQPEIDMEEEFDDADYTPHFIQRLLDQPPLLPNESRDELWQVFGSFEYTDKGSAKTAVEYMLVYSATMLTWNVMRYRRMEVALLRNQERPALESLVRKTHDGAAMEGATAGLRIAANQDATKYYADPMHRKASTMKFEAAG